MADTGRIHSVGLVGRSRELAVVNQACVQATNGQGQAIFLVGESGIGKTRMVTEAARAAAGLGMRVLIGRGSSVGSMVPFRPIAEALLSVFRGTAAPDSPELAPFVPALARLIPDWNDHRGSGGAVELLMMAESVLRLLMVTSRERGALLLLDDLADADTESLFVIDYLVDNLRADALLLLGALRDAPSPSLDLVRSAGRREACRLITLERLGPASVRSLAAGLLGTEPHHIPTATADLLWQHSAGNPFLLEVFLDEMLDKRLLVPDRGDWQVTDAGTDVLSSALVTNVASRTERLGPQGHTLLATAAVLGRRFPLSIAQRAARLEDRTVLRLTRAAVDQQLFVPDPVDPDWYEFRHPLVVEAVLATLTLSTRSAIAASCAQAVELMHPGLPGDWCALAAALRLDAQDERGAGARCLELGRRVLADGAPETAITMLTKADALLTPHHDQDTEIDLLGLLITALGEVGQFEHAARLATRFAGLDSARAAAMHTKLATAAYLAGRPADGLEQARAARGLLAAGVQQPRTAEIDAIEANLLLELPGSENAAAAGRLAARALRLSNATDEPTVACQALQVLGIVAAQDDLETAQEHFVQARAVAEEHALSHLRVQAMTRLGGHRLLVDGDTHDLDAARSAALRTGAITVSSACDAILALHAVLRSEFDHAAELLGANLATLARLQLTDLVRYTHMTRMIHAGHRADRRAMDSAFADFRRVGGEGSREMPLCLGLARVFCSLLEEDRPRARRELAAAFTHDDAAPTRYHLSGRHGIGRLLDVLDNRGGSEPGQARSAPAQMRWNLQFVQLADAVSLGRRGQRQRATAEARAARQTARPYPLARHLGARLIAEAALEDGWGQPVEWLQEAERYFHAHSIPAPASACRAILRGSGVSVHPHRSGEGRVPVILRSAGVTAREYDVLLLLAQPLSNKEIAARLHISPRTVEKHVSSLMAKTNHPSRTTLFEHVSLDADLP